MLDRYAHLASVPLRLALGAVFIAHGLPKLMNTAGIAGLFGQIGLPAPFAMALLIGLIEVIGGLMVIAGFCMRIAAGLLALIMVAAIATVKWKQGFLNGWEFDLVLLAGALSLMLSSPSAKKA